MDHAVEGVAQFAEFVRTPDVDGSVEIARSHLFGEAYALPDHAGDLAENEEDEQAHEQQRAHAAQDDFAAQAADVASMASFEAAATTIQPFGRVV